MARNLMEEEKKKTAEIKTESEEKETEVKVITTEQLLIHNLEMIIKQEQLIYDKMLECFKKLGVKLDN